MAPKLAHLRSMTDEQIVEQYDQAAPTTVIGTGFYLDELSRREFQRASAAALAEAASARRLTIANALVAVVAVVIAVLVPLLTAQPKTEPCTTIVGDEQRPALCLAP